MIPKNNNVARVISFSMGRNFPWERERSNLAYRHIRTVPCNICRSPLGPLNIVIKITHGHPYKIGGKKTYVSVSLFVGCKELLLFFYSLYILSYEIYFIWKLVWCFLSPKKLVLLVCTPCHQRRMASVKHSFWYNDRTILKSIG